MPKTNDLAKRCKDNVKPYLMWLAVSALLVAADQISKLLIVKYLPEGVTVRVIPYLFDFVYVENRGAAWGMLANSRWVFIVISSAAIIMIAGILLYTARNRKLFVIPLVLIFAGGIGNMIDRLSKGFVVDFIQFDFFKSFPVFNVADSYVSVGGVMMLIYLLFIDRSILADKKKEENERTENGGGDAGA